MNHKLSLYYLAGDETFSLISSLIQCYPKKDVKWYEKYFHFYLKVRKSVECAFRTLISKLCGFERPIAYNEDCVEAIVKKQYACSTILFTFKRENFKILPILLRPMVLCQKCRMEGGWRRPLHSHKLLAYGLGWVTTFWSQKDQALYNGNM